MIATDYKECKYIYIVLSGKCSVRKQLHINDEEAPPPASKIWDLMPLSRENLRRLVSVNNFAFYTYLHPQNPLNRSNYVPLSPPTYIPSTAPTYPSRSNSEFAKFSSQNSPSSLSLLENPPSIYTPPTYPITSLTPPPTYLLLTPPLPSPIYPAPPTYAPRPPICLPSLVQTYPFPHHPHLPTPPLPSYLTIHHKNP